MVNDIIRLRLSGSVNDKKARRPRSHGRSLSMTREGELSAWIFKRIGLLSPTGAFSREAWLAGGRGGRDAPRTRSQMPAGNDRHSRIRRAARSCR